GRSGRHSNWHPASRYEQLSRQLIASSVSHNPKGKNNLSMLSPKTRDATYGPANDSMFGVSRSPHGEPTIGAWGGPRSPRRHHTTPTRTSDAAARFPGAGRGGGTGRDGGDRCGRQPCRHGESGRAGGNQVQAEVRPPPG